MPNYYEVLGVPENASDEDIKKTYRKLSLKYHPDRNADPDAKQKFQEFSQAYEVLSDPETKQRHDHELKFGAGGGMGPGGMGPGGMGPGGMGPGMEEFMDMNNIFNMMFNGGIGRMNSMHGIHGMPNGGIRIFHNGQQVFANMMGKPEPIVKQIQITLEQSYHGCNIPVEIERNCIENNNMRSIEKETIYVNLLAGIDDNEQLVIPDKGHRQNDVAGDVKLVVKVVNETCFIRNGLDLVFRKSLSLKESLCGFSFEMTHLNGKKLCINNKNNPTVIKPNFMKVIQSMGMNRENSVGNMIIQFDVVFPDTLSGEQIAALLAVL